MNSRKEDDEEEFSKRSEISASGKVVTVVDVEDNRTAVTPVSTNPNPVDDQDVSLASSKSSQPVAPPPAFGLKKKRDSITSNSWSRTESVTGNNPDGISHNPDPTGNPGAYNGGKGTQQLNYLFSTCNTILLVHRLR